MLKLEDASPSPGVRPASYFFDKQELNNALIIKIMKNLFFSILTRSSEDPEFRADNLANFLEGRLLSHYRQGEGRVGELALLFVSSINNNSVSCEGAPPNSIIHIP